jgi:predicted nucleotidyltransferase
MTAAQARSAVDRFAAACAADPDVVAAFLGGSYAAGTAHERSDLDLYVVADEGRYAAFFARREAFMRSWAAPSAMEVVRDFEGLGFDMLDFACAEGVWGQVALGHTGNYRRLHGGPHVVLVDEQGVLDGVTFPLL